MQYTIYIEIFTLFRSIVPVFVDSMVAFVIYVPLTVQGNDSELSHEPPHGLRTYIALLVYK